MDSLNLCKNEFPFSIYGSFMNDFLLRFPVATFGKSLQTLKKWKIKNILMPPTGSTTSLFHRSSTPLALHCNSKFQAVCLVVYFRRLWAKILCCPSARQGPTTYPIVRSLAHLRPIKACKIFTIILKHHVG